MPRVPRTARDLRSTLTRRSSWQPRHDTAGRRNHLNGRAFSHAQILSLPIIFRMLAQPQHLRIMVKNVVSANPVERRQLIRVYRDAQLIVSDLVIRKAVAVMIDAKRDRTVECANDNAFRSRRRCYLGRRSTIEIMCGSSSLCCLCHALFAYGHPPAR